MAETESSSNVATAFNLFPRLPAELQLMVWKNALPSPRDLKIGGRSASTGENMIIVKKSWSLRAPMGLLGACRESRRLALSHGSFQLINSSIDSSDDEPEVRYTWFDRSGTTIYVNSSSTGIYDSLRILSPFTDTRALTFLWPFADSFRRHMREICEDPMSPNFHISKIYYALSGIVLDTDAANRDDHCWLEMFYDESEFKILSLDDSQVPRLLALAFAKAKETRPESLVHQTPECYLQTLKSYWHVGLRPKQVRKTVRSRHLESFPAIIFGKTRESAFFNVERDSLNDRIHERKNGLLFTKTDMNSIRGRWNEPIPLEELGMKYDCRRRCKVQVSPEIGTTSI